MPGPNKVGKKTGRKTQYGRDEYITIKGEKVSEKSRTLKSRKKSMLPKQDYVNVPSIHDGYQYTEEQLSRMLKEGRVKPTSKHRNIPEAVKQAKKRSKNMKFKYKGGLSDTIPPKRGPNPQGLKHGGCPHREIGVKSDIKGISGIQLKGQKFTGTK